VTNRRKPLVNFPRWCALYRKTYTQVAAAAGVALSTISHVVNGTRPRWGGLTEEKILAAMERIVPTKGMSIGQLRDRERYPKRDTVVSPGTKLKIKDRRRRKRQRPPAAVQAHIAPPPVPPTPPPQTPADLGLRVAGTNLGRER